MCVLKPRRRAEAARASKGCCVREREREILSGDNNIASQAISSLGLHILPPSSSSPPSFGETERVLQGFCFPPPSPLPPPYNHPCARSVSGRRLFRTVFFPRVGKKNLLIWGTVSPFRAVIAAKSGRRGETHFRKQTRLSSGRIKRSVIFTAKPRTSSLLFYPVLLSPPLPFSSFLSFSLFFFRGFGGKEKEFYDRRMSGAVLSPHLIESFYLMLNRCHVKMLIGLGARYFFLGIGESFSKR